jgi:hypothetical protein
MSLQAFLSEAILIKPGDCFGKKRLAMTAISTLNKYRNRETTAPFVLAVVCFTNKRSCTTSSKKGLKKRAKVTKFLLRDNLPINLLFILPIAFPLHASQTSRHPGHAACPPRS